MRKLNLLVMWVLLFTAPCFPQSASVTATRYPYDTRPFGKYLVEICTLSGAEPPGGHPPGADGVRTLRCNRTPLQPDISYFQRILRPERIDQTITLKLVCDPNTKDSCDPPQPPLVAGKDFFVSATSDSGRIVRQTILSGSATPVGGNAIVQYRANSPGSIIIRATQAGDEQFKPAASVDLILPVVADEKKASKACSVLPPAFPSTSTQLDAATIVSLLGNPTPFVLVAQGQNTIAIYSTRQPLEGAEPRILGSFQDTIVALAGRTASSLGITPASAKPFIIELRIPHAAALGDLASRVNGLNYSQFTIQDVGSNQVRITTTAQPDCDTWKNFLTDIRQMAWQLVAEPMSKKLYYLSSSDVAAGFSALASSAPPSSSNSPSSNSASAPSSPASGTPSGSTPSSGAAGAPAAATTGASSSNATISIAQPPGSNIQISSDTTPCVIAGLTFGNASACAGTATPGGASGGTGGSPAAGPAASPVPKPPLAMASVAVATGPTEQTPPDLLVFSDTNPGDDAQVQERLRVIAQLDLPRPEMIINAWVTQNSSTSPQAMGAFTNLVKRIVADYNQQFENVVLKGWESIKRQSQESDYFHKGFRSYVEDRFVADSSKEKTGTSAQEMSQAFLDNSQAQLADTIGRDEIRDLGICPPSRYCLGYNSLFHPLKPVLTDLLLTIIAAEHPAHVADTAINDIQDGNDAIGNIEECDHTNWGEWKNEVRNRCHAIWSNLEMKLISPKPDRPSCAELDYRGILYSLLYNADHEPRVHLQCFKDEVHRLMATSPDGRAYGAGLLRAKIADFLYNYKLSQQYPHEFQPYDLTQSADALNSALNPLIDAFNQDITAYQLFVRADMEYQVNRLNSEHDERCCVKRLFGLDKPSFFNDGLITVRTISGQLTTVNTTSQSFLNVSTAPQLSTLLTALTASPPPPPSSAQQGTNTQGSNSQGSTGGSNPPATHSTPQALISGTPLGILSGLLANYQTTFAQIGRGLNISAVPRSLSTASAAEIAITLNADESASPSLYSTGGTTDPVLNTSRVANHDTTTRVRVDSVKLFEVSSLTAILSRSRSRFPLLPPFVEIPYIGTFAGIPLGAAKEFHNSTAILSAYVAPTAADIAYGLRFVSDLVLDGLNPGRCSVYKGAAGPDVTNVCVFRKALSIRDFGYNNLSNFNKAIVRCLANDYPSGDCQSITFDDVPRMP